MNKKFSIYILNHGEFGEHLIQSAELIVGKIENVTAFSLTREMSLHDFIALVEQSIVAEQEVLILTDMFGGTPNNVAMYLQQKYNCQVISGVNLPMLLDLVLSRDNSDASIETLIPATVATGKNSIEHQVVVTDESLN